MKKILMFINPSSGTAKGKNTIYQIVETFNDYNCEVTIYLTGPNTTKDISQVLKDRSDDFDIIACYGGDGTLNYLVNTMLALDIKKPIGYIPGGSTNDFAHNFFDASDINQICKEIALGEAKPFDVGSFNGKYFNYVAAFGAFTTVSYSTDQNMKNILGHGAYIVNAVGTLNESLTYKRHLVIEHDGETLEGDFIYGGISNSTQVGGMQLADTDIQLSDGYFEVMLVPSPTSASNLASELGQLVSKNTEDKYIIHFKTKHMKITSADMIDWTIDGEFGGSYKEVEINVLPSAMAIVTKEK